MGFNSAFKGLTNATKQSSCWLRHNLVSNIGREGGGESDHGSLGL